MKLWQSVRKKQDEIGFVPSASSEPRGAHYWCDNRCSDKALRYMLIASMAILEGGEARTINLCQLCFTAKLVQPGKQPLKSQEWHEVVENKAHRGRLWKIFGSEQLLRGTWEYCTLKRAWTRKKIAAAAQENQEGIQSQWQKESPFREVLEQVKRSADTDCGAQTMRRACSAMKLGNWESFEE